MYICIIYIDTKNITTKNSLGNKFFYFIEFVHYFENLYISYCTFLMYVLETIIQRIFPLNHLPSWNIHCQLNQSDHETVQQALKMHAEKLVVHTYDEQKEAIEENNDATEKSGVGSNVTRIHNVLVGCSQLMSHSMLSSGSEISLSSLLSMAGSSQKHLGLNMMTKSASKSSLPLASCVRQFLVFNFCYLLCLQPWVLCVYKYIHR